MGRKKGRATDRMELHDRVASDVLPEMAYTQKKKAERILTALERPMNDHLLRLWTSANSSARETWIGDLINWIDEIAEIVLRPANPPAAYLWFLLNLRGSSSICVKPASGFEDKVIDTIR
jgi:hypothetical protein